MKSYKIKLRQRAVDQTIANVQDVFWNICFGLIIATMIVKHLLRNLTGLDLTYSKYGFV